MSINIAIIDYGMGNLQTVYRKLARLGADVYIAANAANLARADKIVMPGIGHFAKAMENLHSSGLFETLNEKVLVKNIPVLGICLGMQLMCEESEEGDSKGLGWIKARVEKFKVQNPLLNKIPHTGWNTININKESRLLKGIKEETEFYFLHSYHLTKVPGEDVLTHTHYDYNFVSSIEKGNIFGTQFHPEKSHDDGELILKNFISI